MPTTTRLSLRYPATSDTADVPRDIGNLASDIDKAAIFSKGLFSARPTSTVGSPGIDGRYYFATDTSRLYLDTGTSWVEVSTAAAPTYVTSLPSSPTDGQEIYYAADATNGVIWHFRYRTAASKWEFVGGPPLTAYVGTSQTTTSTSYAALTTSGPSVTLPLAGDYVVGLGAEITSGNPSLSSARMSYDIGATGALDADSIVSSRTNLPEATYRQQLKTGLTAVTLTAKYKAVDGGLGAGTATFAYRHISVLPVRI